MSKHKPPTPPTDDKVISLADVRKRVEAEAKKTGKSIHDMFHELFGTALGFPPGPYVEAVQKQQQEVAAKELQERFTKEINKQIVDPLKATIERAIAHTERALNAAENWKAEAEHLHGDHPFDGTTAPAQPVTPRMGTAIG